MESRKILKERRHIFKGLILLSLMVMAIAKEEKKEKVKLPPKCKSSYGLPFQAN
jgi:hypothetical protein